MEPRVTHTLRDTLVSLLGILGITTLYNLREKRRGPLVRVLVFHDVTDAVWFDSVMKELSLHVHFLSPSAFEAGNFMSDRVNVLVTFDDGYASWVEICLSILAKYKCTAVFLVNSGLLDSKDKNTKATYVRERLLLSTMREVLTWDGLRALAHEGHTIGGHTRTHARLGELQDDVALEEIRGDKARVEAELDSTLTWFAYPFGNPGDYTKRTAALVRESGYQYACTTEAAFVSPGGERMVIPRLCLPDGLSPRAVRSWVSGGYDVLRKLKKLCVE